MAAIIWLSFLAICALVAADEGTSVDSDATIEQVPLEFPTGREEFIVVDFAVEAPKNRTPDKEVTKDGFSVELWKVNKLGTEECVHQLVIVSVTSPTQPKSFEVAGRVACLVGSEVPLEKVIKTAQNPSGECILILKLKTGTFARSILKWKEGEAKPALLDIAIFTDGTSIDQVPLEGETPQDTTLDELFGSSNTSVWDKDYIQSKITVRLVKKSWKPPGVSCDTDEKLDSYPGTKEDAFKILHGTETYEYEEREYKQAQDLLTVKDDSGKQEYDPSLPSIVILHPISTSADSKYAVTTVTALAMRNLHKHNNIFVLDMPELQPNMILTSMYQFLMVPPMFEPMAEGINDFFLNAIESKAMKAEDINLIGYSYAAQLAGYVGRGITEKTSQKIGSILALDPHGVVQNSYLKPVNKDDAKVVHVYHCQGFPLGTTARVATADFTFNGGFLQPECVKANDPIQLFICSHRRVLLKFWYIVLFGGELFIARKCDNFPTFNAGQCDKQTFVEMTYPISDSIPPGRYFARTQIRRPYGMGSIGSLADPETKEKMATLFDKSKGQPMTGLDFEMVVKFSLLSDI